MNRFTQYRTAIAEMFSTSRALRVRSIWKAALEKWGSKEAVRLAGDNVVYSLKGAKILAEKLKQPEATQFDGTADGLKASQQPSAAAAVPVLSGTITTDANWKTTAPTVSARANLVMPEISSGDANRKYVALCALDALGIEANADATPAQLEAQLADEQARIASQSKAVETALAEAKSKVATATSTSAWNVQSLSALIDATFAPGTARNELDRVAATSLSNQYDVSATSNAAKLNRTHGTREREAIVGQMKADARKRHIASQAPDAQTKRFDTLRQFLCTHRLSVPGLSYAGLTINDNAHDELGPNRRAAAQARVDAFCGVLFNRDEQACISANPAAQSARAFIAHVSGRPYTVGATPHRETWQERDAKRFPNAPWNRQ